MFSQASVILFTGGGICGRGHAWWGACMAGGVCGKGGACMVVGVHGGGCTLSRDNTKHGVGLTRET